MSTKEQKSGRRPASKAAESEEEQIAQIGAQLQTLVEMGVISDDDVMQLIRKVDQEARATAGLPARDAESFKRQILQDEATRSDEEGEDEWEDEEVEDSEVEDEDESEALKDEEHGTSLDESTIVKKEDEKADVCRISNHV